MLFFCSCFFANSHPPFPIGFSIPEIKIVTEIPHKDKDFAHIIPGNRKTYIYNSELDYYNDYRRSYYAFTWKKCGWDCMRHYEILASGCIPYFTNLEKCNPNTMHFLPKDLIKEAMQLEGVSYGKIDHTKFNIERYYEILNQLLEHTRNYLTTRSMAQYFLDSINYSGNGKILFLSRSLSPDYMKECLLIGLKEILGDRVIDALKIDYIYTNYPRDTKKLYGKGFSYTKIIEDLPVDRSNLEQRIQNKEFDLIIYGSVHRSCPFHETVKKYYEPEKIIYVCGEDCHTCSFVNVNTLFLREYDAFKG